MRNSMARSGGATLAKGAHLFPQASAVAASARSGLPAKVSHAGIKQAMRHLIAKPPTAGGSLLQAVSGASRATAWLSGTSPASKIKALSAGPFSPSCMAANVGISFAANAAAACHATARKGAAVIPLVTRGLSTTTNPAAACHATARKGVAVIPLVTRGLCTTTNPAAAGQAMARKFKGQAAGICSPSSLAAKVNVAAAGKVTARKGVAGIPFTTRGLSTSTKVTNPAAAGQATARKIPLKGNSTPNLSLRRAAVLVWSIAAGLTATWYFLKKVPDSSEPKIHIRFEECVPSSEEIEENGIPESLDWSELGRLPSTPRVISFFYQYFCGSCWAIATVKSVEWAYAIKYGRVFSLSVQQLVDCSSKYAYGDKRQYQGCFGGLLRYAFQYVKETGLTVEKAYPCFLWQGACKLAGRPIAVRIDGFEEIPPTEDDFIMALQTGPIAVYLHANEYFAFFSGGKILELQDCPSSGPRNGCFHCVVLVGYGIDDDGGKFWKIQNTHGVLWGEDGYARLRRGVSDPHGVACMLRYPGYRPTGVHDA